MWTSKPNDAYASPSSRSPPSAPSRPGEADLDHPSQVVAHGDELIHRRLGQGCRIATRRLAAQAERDTAREDLAAGEEDRDTAIARADEAEGELAAAEEEAAAEAERAETSGAQFGDGTWVVGEDIELGVYSNSGGGFGDIIANDNPDGPAVIEISGSDAAFSSQGCDTWTRE